MNSPRSKLRGITSDLQSRSDKKDFSYPLRPSLLQAAGNSKLNRIIFDSRYRIRDFVLQSFMCLSAFVNLPAMTNCQYQDNHFFFLDVTQYPIISNPVSPEASVITL